MDIIIILLLLMLIFKSSGHSSGDGYVFYCKQPTYPRPPRAGNKTKKWGE